MLRMLEVLRQQVRQAEGRGAESSVGIIDSQSGKAADNVGRDTRGYDVGEKVAGCKALHRHRPLRPAHHGERLSRETCCGAT
ncbi:hypothetical protein [Actinomadura sp. K4S16]|uniref:hypothetical protein n=1 Tax=Actinomadura sp. K4S16 TaxID=1316147 RepID=UPI00135AFF9F|nr:hypothetical protein [Actinomadura sp. K4S16]